MIQLHVWRLEPEWRKVKVKSQRGKTSNKGMAIDESPVHESKKMLGGHRVKSVLPSDMDNSSHA
jgi:hypothetical protein